MNTNNQSETFNAVLNNESDYLNFSSELAHARTLEDLAGRIRAIVHDIGFTDFMFMRLQRTWQSHSMCGLLHSFPDEFMRMYHESKLYDVDLVIHYGRCNTQPIFSSQIYQYIDNASFELDLMRENRLLMQLYKRFSFFEHLVTPLAAYNGNGNVQLLLSKQGEDIQKLQSMAHNKVKLCRALCKAIDSVTTKKFRSSFIDQQDNLVSITRKPLAILQHMACKDMTITDLASEMSISPITAHQHISTARKALSVKTNIGAVIKAYKLGLIRVD